jgi:DNA-directed RNA polymerase I subunit RPA1
MAKFVGRLTLLDHGLLTASLELAKLSASISFATIQPDADDDKDAAAEDTQEEKEEKEAESEESYIKRMEDFVRSAIRAGGKQAENRDQYKDGLVFEERKKVIGEFAKKGYKKCQKCKA